MLRTYTKIGDFTVFEVIDNHKIVGWKVQNKSKVTSDNIYRTSAEAILQECYHTKAGR